jgi:hypothetical protein
MTSMLSIERPVEKLKELSQNLRVIQNVPTLSYSNLLILSKGQAIRYNDKMFYKHAFESDFNCAFSYDIFQAMMSNLHEKLETLNIELLEDNIIFKGKRGFNLTIACQSAKSLMRSLKQEIACSQEWIKFPKPIEDLMSAIALCSSSTSDIDNLLSQLKISFKEGIVESCDNLKASRYRLDSKKVEKPDILLHGKLLQSVVPLKPIAYCCCSPAWVHFLLENGNTIGIKRLAGYFDYPDLSSVFGGQEKARELHIPESILVNLKQVLNRAKIILSDNITSAEKQVLIEIKDGKKNDSILMISAESQTGKFRERIMMSTRMDPIKFQAPIIPLFNAISSVSDVAITFKICKKKLFIESDKFKLVLTCFVGKE